MRAAGLWSMPSSVMCSPGSAWTTSRRRWTHALPAPGQTDRRARPTPSHTIGWSHSCSPWLTAQGGHAPEAPPRIQHMVAGIWRSARRIVVKVGSSLVTNEGRGLDEAAIGEWSRQLAALVRGDAGAAREVVMVSSGAIAEGMKRLGWVGRPREIHALQAAAAVGQMGLAQMYETKLREQGMGSAQVLLTHADLADRERYLNARSTLLTLQRLGVVPVINENDTVVNDEIKFGDNDTLGALVANLVEADALFILTDQKWLYTAVPRLDPSARPVRQFKSGDGALERMAGGAASNFSKARMITMVLPA